MHSETTNLVLFMSVALEVPIQKADYQPISNRNTDPNAFWGEMDRLNLTRGPLEQAGQPTSGPRWEFVTPDGQYVPPDDGEHFMLAPRDPEHFLRVEHLEVPQLVPATASMLTFTGHNPNRFAGYNIGPDHSRKTSQTWHNLHIHFVELPSQDHLTQKSTEPPKLREVGWHLQNNALLEVFGQENGILPGVSSVRKPDQYPKGGMELVLDDSLDAKTFADTLKSLDTAYRTIHRETASLFVNNYDDVVDSNGQVAYDCKSADEREAAISERFAGGQEPHTEAYVRYMNRLVGISEVMEARGQIHDPSRSHAITRMPAYSAVLTTDAETSQRVLKVGAHIFRDRGGAELLGIELKRQFVPEIREDGRMERAVQEIARLKTAS